MRRSMTFRMDEGLVARVDAAVGAGSARNRTAFLEEALEAFLSRADPGLPDPPAVASRPLDVSKRERLEVARTVLRAASSSDAKAGVLPVGWPPRGGAS